MILQLRYLIQIVIICLILYVFDYLLYKNEYFDNDKIILKSWWTGDDKRSIEIFKQLFSNQLDIYNRIEIHSVFGNNFDKDNNVLYVQFSGESYYNDPILFNINFIPSEDHIMNNIILPYAYYHILYNNIDINPLLTRRVFNKNKTDFCLFAVSNINCKERNNFFHKLSEYKKVDSCGKAMNNIGYNCPGNHDDEVFGNFISKYKFMICFENKSQTNYLTEKIINAYYNGTIPIYWGSPTINKYINMDAILYLKPDFTENDVTMLIEEIINLDNNDELYKNKYESIFFKDGLLPDEFNIDKIKEKINSLC